MPTPAKHRKPIFPAYGRELMRRRQSGEHPDPGEYLLVALHFWPYAGAGRRAWPAGRFVVVTDDMPIARLELRMLAGTRPLIAADDSRIDRARQLALRLIQVEPLGGWVDVLLYQVGVFAGLRAPDEWTDFTRLQEKHWKPLAEDLAAMAARNQGNERTAAA